VSDLLSTSVLSDGARDGVVKAVMSHRWAEPSSRHRDFSRGATVIVEEPTKTLASANATDMLHCRHSINQLVVQALVIPFMVVVRDELGDHPSEMTFTERDHPGEALVLD
jgi:hypothetical protein